MKNTNRQIIQMEAARELGIAAQAKGIPCAPVLDTDLMALIANNEPFTSGPTMKRWISGWTEANFAATQF